MVGARLGRPNVRRYNRRLRVSLFTSGTTNVTVNAEVATATASGPVPSITISPSVSAPVAVATASAPVPSISIGGVTIIDDFNRADESPIAGPWATGSIQDSGTPNGLKVVSNALSAQFSGASNGYISGAARGPDYFTEITLSTLPADGGYVALFIRGSGFGTSGWGAYYLVWVRDTTSGDSWDLRKRVSGSVTSGLGGGPANITTLSAGDKIGIEVSGSTIKAYKKISGTRTNILTATDTDISAAGAVGIEIDSTTARYDDYTGGSPTPTTTVNAPVAAATASAPSPSLTISSSVSAAVGVLTASAPVPSLNIGTNVTINVTSGQPQLPLILTGNQAPWVVASAPTPTVSISSAVTLSPPAAAATASFPTPSIVISPTVSAPVATATASAPTPGMTRSIGAVPGVLTASAPVPGINTGATLPTLHTVCRVVITEFTTKTTEGKTSAASITPKVQAVSVNNVTITSTSITGKVSLTSPKLVIDAASVTDKVQRATDRTDTITAVSIIP